MRTFFKTSLFVMLLLSISACKEDIPQQYNKKEVDYSSLFDYNVTLYVNNMTDEEVIVQLVYPGSYKKERIKEDEAMFKTKVNALELLKYFDVDMSDKYLENGEIRYIISCQNKIVKYGWLNRINNFSDNIINKNSTGEIYVTGSSQTHLDD